MGVSSKEAFEAGRKCYEAEIKQIWLETHGMGEFAENVAGHIGEL